MLHCGLPITVAPHLEHTRRLAGQVNHKPSVCASQRCHRACLAAPTLRVGQFITAGWCNKNSGIVMCSIVKFGEKNFLNLPPTHIERHENRVKDERNFLILAPDNDCLCSKYFPRNEYQASV